MKNRIFWSNNLAYAIGLITTDGNLSKDGRHINLTSKDLDQITLFSQILCLKNKVGMKKSGYVNTKKYYFIQFGNVLLYRFLIAIGLHPNKSKTLGCLSVPDRYFIHFLRGHLDGDGYTYSYWDKRWKKSFRLYTGFVSASKSHLTWLQQKVYAIHGISGKIKNGGPRTYQLMYAKKSSLLLLKKIYEGRNISFLKRKKDKVDNALNINETSQAQI